MSNTIIKEYLTKRLFFKLRDKAIKEHELTYLFWECTLRCNLSCLHCGSDCLSDSSVKDMPKEDFIKVLDDIKKNNPDKKLFVCITGGEPLLRKDLEDVGREIVKRGFSWGIVTNGLFLTEERFNSLVSAGMLSISVSLDGLEEDHNYLRRNPKSFENVSKAIDFIVKQSKKNPKFLYDVITCVHDENFKNLEKIRNYLFDKNVEFWRIFSIWPEGRASKTGIKLSFEKYTQLLDFIAETNTFKNSNDKKISCSYSCEGYLGRYERKVRKNFFFCIAGVHVASVMCNGDVTGCLSIRNKDFIQGNIYTEYFSDIWENQFTNMRNREWAKVGQCKHCKQWKSCLGNGIHLHSDMKSEPCRCHYRLIKGGK